MHNSGKIMKIRNLGKIISLNPLQVEVGGSVEGGGHIRPAQIAEGGVKLLESQGTNSLARGDRVLGFIKTDISGTLCFHIEEVKNRLVVMYREVKGVGYAVDDSVPGYVITGKIVALSPLKVKPASGVIYPAVIAPGQLESMKVAGVEYFSTKDIVDGRIVRIDGKDVFSINSVHLGFFITAQEDNPND